MHQKSQLSASGAADRKADIKPSLYKDVIERIIRELEQGRVPWVQPWDASGDALGMPRSAAIRRAYSGRRHITTVPCYAGTAEQEMCHSDLSGKWSHPVGAVGD